MQVKRTTVSTINMKSRAVGREDVFVPALVGRSKRCDCIRDQLNLSSDTKIVKLEDIETKEVPDGLDLKSDQIRMYFGMQYPSC